MVCARPKSRAVLATLGLPVYNIGLLVILLVLALQAGRDHGGNLSMILFFGPLLLLPLCITNHCFD